MGRWPRPPPAARDSTMKPASAVARRSIASRSSLRCLFPAGYGSANATYASPDFVPIFPPPAAMTTNCLPPTEYTAGVA